MGALIVPMGKGRSMTDVDKSRLCVHVCVCARTHTRSHVHSPLKHLIPATAARAIS